MSLTLAWSEHWTQPDDPAISHRGITRTWADLGAGIRRAVGWLDEAGLGRGDVIALQLPKGLPFLEVHLAALAIGAITLPLNPRYTPREVGWMLDDSGARLAVVPDAGGASTPRMAPEDLAPALDAAHQRPLPDGVDLEEIGVLCYTSGTTGRAKGARIRQRNIQAMVESLHQAWRWSRTDRLLHALPLFHVHGLFVAQHGALRAGAHAIWLDRFDPVDALDAIEAHQATIFMGVPTFYHRMLQADPGSRNLGSVRLFTSGSAGLPATDWRAWRDETGHEIVERYGMTEIGIVVSNPLEGPRKPGAIGVPLPGVEARIHAGEDRHPVSPGEVGELEIRGPSVFAGYLGRPEATAAALVDGWMRTGDLATFDEDGWIHLAGRRSELVIRGGLNVYPAEVEAALLEDSAILEAAVFGVADPDLGERVHAAVVLAHEVEPGELLLRATAGLAPYKRPERLHVVDELPRNAMGKVLKPELRARYGPV